MDFIEKIFGISPDGGSGALEFALLVAPVAIGAMIVIIRRLRDPP